jgi:exopolysaccharide biosynthesis polyprenyl glycosylphosphotransferase
MTTSGDMLGPPAAAGAVVDLTDAALEHVIRPREGGSTRAGVVAASEEVPSPVEAGPPPLHEGSTRPRTGAAWRRRHVVLLVVLDAGALATGWAIPAIGATRLAVAPPGARSLVALVALGLLWLAVVSACRGYDDRLVGVGLEEFRRMANAAVWFTALVALAAHLCWPQAARGLVAVVMPVTAAGSLLLRRGVRVALARRRCLGDAVHRALVVGPAAAAGILGSRLDRASSGLTVVGTWSPARSGHAGDEPALADVAPSGRGATPSPVPDDEDAVDLDVSDLRRLLIAVRERDADTVLVPPGTGWGPDTLRRLAWALEGTGVDLLLACAPTDVARSRLALRPVSGLMLLQVREPEFTGGQRLVKDVIDRAGAALLLVALAPLMVAVATAVRIQDPGPVIFRQVRVGRGGVPFTMFKFRTMQRDSERLRAALASRNDHRDGVLFKMRGDPRITGIGRWLRRVSLDELPQLVNVLLGQMSLVGPRPPLPAEVDRYGPQTQRRLLVRPGMTGLWQVSGRADLSWQDTVRLDLYYVENWSVALDSEILFRTISAVLTGKGAR